MVDSYLCTKIGVISLDGFWENAFYGRTTTTDARATALALLTQLTRAKNKSHQIQIDKTSKDRPKTLNLSGSPVCLAAAHAQITFSL